MKQLGNFQVADKELAPVVVAICFDTATRSVKFVLAQDSDMAVPFIRHNTSTYEVDGLLDNVSVTSSQPSNGGGIVRHSVSLQIQTTHTKGYPFFQNIISKKFYQAGQNLQDFYFAIYAVDRRKISEDIRLGAFFGYFQIQSGAGWVERDGRTTLPLVDILINDDTLIGATLETIPDSFFLFNPWFDEQIVPKVWGQVARVKMLNSFPSFSTRDLSASINGRVESTYTNVSTTIVLEKYADQSSVLRQIIAIGGTVKVKMADGEVIQGTLAYNAGTGEVTLTVTARNTSYDTVQGYTYAGVGQDPTQWASTASEQRIPTSWSNLSSVLLDGKRRVQDSSGWMQATLDFYDSSQAQKAQTVVASVQMQGWDNEAENVIKHNNFKLAIGGIDVTSTLSFDFSSTLYGVVQTGMGPLQQWTWNAGPYLKFLNTTKTVSLYFRNPATAAAGGAIGSGWQLVNITPAVATYECYIRNGFSHFDNDHVFCEGDGRLIKIPTANVVSVTNSTTVSGLAGMAKIVLTAAPLDMNIGATSNTVYTDAMYRTGTNENRSERILYEILKESNLQYLAGENLTTDLYASNWLPYFGCLARKVETVTEIVDRILFQLGATFRWSYDKFYIRATGQTHHTDSTVTIAAQSCTKPLVQALDQDETLLESAKIDMGQFKTRVAAGFEYIAFYLDVDYGAWEDPYYKPVKSGVNRAIKPYERKFNYAFDLIQDPASANFAVGSALSIGHPSGWATIERSLSIDCTLSAARFEALDPILFRNFPLISTADETNALFDTDGTPCYVNPGDGKKFLMGALCQISEVVYDFSMDDPKVSITAKMAQTFVQANGVSIYGPPYPPQPPPVPSTDPNSPPNQTGGSGGAHSYGGYYSPMDATTTVPVPIVIDSLTAETTSFVLDVSAFSINNGGWSYYITLHPSDSAPSGYDGAATITAAGSGTFADKLNDAYVSVPKTVGISVTYQWFLAVAAAVVSRGLTVRIHRQMLAGGSFSSIFVEDTVDVPVTITLRALSDITAA